MPLLTTFDLVSLLASLAALMILLVGWKRIPGREVKLFIVGLLISNSLYALFLVVEWSGITRALEPYENIIGALIPMWWAFVFYAFILHGRNSDLRKSEKNYRRLADNSIDCIWIMDFDLNSKYINPAIEQMMGFKPEEWIGSNMADHADFEHLGIMKDAVARAIHVLPETPWVSFEAEMVHKDGHAVPVEISGRIVFDERGNPAGIQGVARDLSERKQAEKEREDLIAKLEVQNAELERFAYTVSHDLKSPLITVKGFVGMLREDLEEGNHEAVGDDLSRISAAAGKMGRLLSDLLELSRIGRLVNPPEEVALDELSHKAMKLAHGQIEQRGVQVEILPGLPVVYGDRVRLLEVVQNLIDNAVKYMGDQSEPRIEIGSRQDGSETVCYVRDNGIGIERSYAEKVFGLFEQLDPKAEGSGIGLAVVKRIVDVHGGRIWVESEGAGHGSTFCFTLPLQEPAP